MDAQEPIERLVRELSSAQDKALERLPLPPRRRTTRSSRPIVAYAAAAALVVALSALAFGQRDKAIAFEVNGRPAAAGAWIVVAPATESALSFSDGSTVLLTGGARAQVSALTARGATLRLARGRALVSVHHTPSTQWRVDAGPYTVHVVGTRFSVEWDAARERFSLDLSDGRVRIEGPGLQSRVLIAGQSTAASVREPDAPPPPSASTAPPEAVRPPAEPRDPPPPAAVDTRLPVVARREREPPPVVSDASAATGEAPRSWRQLFDDGDTAGALAGVQSDGAATIIRRASADELMALVDLARVTRTVQLQREALLELRARFAHTRDGRNAAFLLGRLAFDDARHPAEAASWFERYLSEEPAGPLAREAHGRLIEALSQSGDLERARRSATDYLSRYPEGPHSQLARSVSRP